MGILRVHKEVEVGNVTWLDGDYDERQPPKSARRKGDRPQSPEGILQGEDTKQEVEDPLLTTLYVNLFND